MLEILPPAEIGIKHSLVKVLIILQKLSISGSSLETFNKIISSTELAITEKS